MAHCSQLTETEGRIPKL